MARRTVNCCLVGLSPLLFFAIGSAVAAPITFNTALPVAKEEFLFRQQFINMQSGDDPSGAQRDRSENMSATTLAYGINNRLALFGVLPYRDIDLSMDMGSGKVSRSNSGLGDISVFARYIFQQNNQAGRTLRLAAFAGLKAPTGEDEASDSIGTLPPPLQLGSGSWDAFGGLVVTRQTLDYQLDAQLSYRINNEANHFEAGNVLRLDASLQKRIWPRELGSGVPGFVYAVLELNATSQEKNALNGTNDNNSGGTRILLAPGLQYVTRRWIAETAVQFPVSQNLNGTALELDTIARAGIRFNF
ncbi:MAG TPA: transporter [Gammaproteobacteria bacterium]|nr:transporter [Gammaproteobacteria bacterium]